MLIPKKYLLVFISLLIFLCLFFAQTSVQYTAISEENLPIVSLWHFNQVLDTPDSIECVKSKTIFDKSTYLCIHSRTDLISASFLNQGEFEGHLLHKFLKYLIDNPDWLAIDIGANLGLYTLFSASTGTKVLAAEPFYDNQIRLHKAAALSGTKDRITLIKNALSNERNQIVKLYRNDKNIGSQGVIPNRTFNLEIKKSLSIDESKYYVQTILFDDIVDYIPLDKNNKKFKKAILKIDIEAHEPYAFQHATKLFDQINICVIFMEWAYIGRNDNVIKERDYMLGFLYSRGYTAYNPGDDSIVLRENYSNWPGDIIWKRQHC
jgi:FkbM family methyltransferase